MQYIPSSLLLVSVIYILSYLYINPLEYSVILQFTLCIEIYKLHFILSNLQDLALEHFIL